MARLLGNVEAPFPSFLVGRGHPQTLWLPDGSAVHNQERLQLSFAFRVTGHLGLLLVWFPSFAPSDEVTIRACLFWQLLTHQLNKQVDHLLFQVPWLGSRLAEGDLMLDSDLKVRGFVTGSP